MTESVVEEGIEAHHHILAGRFDVEHAFSYVVGAKVRCNPEQEFIGEVPQPIEDEYATFVIRVEHQGVQHGVKRSGLAFTGAANQVKMRRECRKRDGKSAARFSVFSKRDRFHGSSSSRRIEANSA